MACGCPGFVATGFDSAQWRPLRSQGRMPVLLPRTRVKPPGWTWKYENATSALAQMDLLNEPGEPARRLRWMAAIISRSSASSNYVRLARQSKAIGFVTLHIPASLPSQYPSRRAMVAELFGCSTVRDVPRLTSFEIALLLSHKRALAAIASSRFDWGVVFEEDATLHPSVRPKQARQLLWHTLAFAGSLGRNLEDLFLFLGACSSALRPKRDAGVLWSGPPIAPPWRALPGLLRARMR